MPVRRRRERGRPGAAARERGAVAGRGQKSRAPVRAGMICCKKYMALLRCLRVPARVPCSRPPS
eukprot:302797-Prymnesium_polylepis.1